MYIYLSIMLNLSLFYRCLHILFLISTLLSIFQYLKVFEELGHFIMNLARHMNLRNSLATMDLSPTVFSKMTELRILKIHFMNFPEGLEYLPNELRFLEWTGYPFKFLPPNFNPSKIVELHKRRSSIEQLWIGTNVRLNLPLIYIIYTANNF